MAASAIVISPTTDSFAGGEQTDSETRYYTNKPGADYFLPSDEVERQRLQLQHDTLKKEVFKGLLPPISLESGDVVLDAGTGSGTWALDVASSLPSVTIYACDVENNLFPLDPPQNVRFFVESVLRLPTEWEGTVTLAHQRLLLVALGEEDWKTALAELYRVLKPGGTIRLEELGSMDIPPDIHGTEWETKLPHTARSLQILDVLYKARNRTLTVYAKIPKWMTEAGFVNIKTDEGTMWVGPGEDGKAGHENFMEVFRAFKQPLLPLGVISSEEYDDFLARMDVEWRNNKLGWKYCSFTAVKPK